MAKRTASSGGCRYWLARITIALSFIAGICAIIAYSYDLYRHGKDTKLIGYFSAAGFVILTFPISIRLIVMHLTHWYSPQIQKYVVRIIWMVPLYSVESWFALRFKQHALYIETVRECYEAYVIFNFLYYLIALLGDETEITLTLRGKSKEKGVHFFPLNWCFSPWVMGTEFLNRCKVGVLQYVFIKNALAAAVFLLEYFQVYGEGKFKFNQGFVYVCIINNLSQMWALYCLVLFYNATKEELSNWRPLGKFLLVKLVVFFTWWQSFVINVVVYSIIGNDTTMDLSWTGTEISTSIQDYLICIEMFVASIAFNYTFNYKEYIGISKVRKASADEEDEHDDDDDIASDERKPFFTAFWQSSIPDDLADIVNPYRAQLADIVSPVKAVANESSATRRQEQTV